MAAKYPYFTMQLYIHLYLPNNGSIEKRNTKIQKYTIIKSESKNKQYAL